MSNVVQSLWIGPRLDAMQILCIKSFLHHGHEYHLYAFDDIPNVPEGTKICDASTILPRESIFCYQHGFGAGSYSAFSNQFRYKLIFEKGGWWVDTDVVCLKPFDSNDDFVFATEFMENGALHTASCVFKSPQRVECLEYCLQVCAAKDKASLRWSEIGPALLHDAVHRFNLTSHLAPVHMFNPINWFEFRDIVRPDFDMSRLAESHAVHLWNQMWRANGIDPEESHPRSLYARLMVRYMPSGATA